MKPGEPSSNSAAMATVLVLLVAALLLCGCGLSVAKVYPKAVSARMFVFVGDEGVASPPEGRSLSKDQIRRLRAALAQEPVPAPTAACFVPHHFFRMYDASGNMVGEIAVCFCCLHIKATPALPIRMAEDKDMGADYKALAALVRELGSTPKADCMPVEIEELEASFARSR